MPYSLVAQEGWLLLAQEEEPLLLAEEELLQLCRRRKAAPIVPQGAPLPAQEGALLCFLAQEEAHASHAQ